MKLLIVGIWAVVVTLGTSYAVASYRLDAAGTPGPDRLEGLRYTSLNTLSIPVIDGGEVRGYVVVRMVYTADNAVLRALNAQPDPFLADEVFRAFYGRAELRFGRLAKIDLAELTETVRTAVNERMGDDVVQDLLVDGLNYIDLSKPLPGVSEVDAAAAPAARAREAAAGRAGFPGQSNGSGGGGATD